MRALTRAGKKITQKLTDSVMKLERQMPDMVHFKTQHQLQAA